MLCSVAEAVRLETAASEGGGREMKPLEGLEEEEEVEADDRRPPPRPPRLLPPPRLSLPPPLSASVEDDIARTQRRHGAGVLRGAAEAGLVAEKAMRMATSRAASIRFFLRNSK